MVIKRNFLYHIYIFVYIFVYISPIQTSSKQIGMHVINKRKKEKRIRSSPKLDKFVFVRDGAKKKEKEKKGRKKEGEKMRSV